MQNENLKLGDCKTFDTNYIGVNEHKIPSSDCQTRENSQAVFGKTVVEKLSSFLHKM
jgi:hypothetical protein